MPLRRSGFESVMVVEVETVNVFLVSLQEVLVHHPNCKCEYIICVGVNDRGKCW